MGADGGQERTSAHVRRAVNGDEESLEWLVTRFSGLLHAQARYRMGPPLQRYYDPSDVVSDVWFAVIPRLRDLRSSDRLTPVLLRFLTTTLINRVNHLARLRLRARVRGDALDDLPHQDGLPTQKIQSVVSSVMEREKDRILHEFLDELSEEDREIIVLRIIEQRPAAEVAELLGLSRANVYVRQQRALARIRSRIPGTVIEELLHGVR